MKFVATKTAEQLDLQAGRTTSAMRKRSQKRSSPRIKSGAGFFGIML